MIYNIRPMKKSEIVIASGLLPALAAGQLTVGEQKFCRPNCDAVLEQPHVPDEARDGTPVRETFAAPSSGPSTDDVPFVPSYDASNDLIRLNWEAQRRATYRQFAANSSSMSAAVIWYASTQAAQSTT